MFNILNGLRVLDLTTVVLVHSPRKCLVILVSAIKIENLDGDMMRAVSQVAQMRWGQVLLIVIATKTVLR